jgi:hypothetical protein
MLENSRLVWSRPAVTAECDNHTLSGHSFDLEGRCRSYFFSRSDEHTECKGCPELALGYMVWGELFLDKT